MYFSESAKIRERITKYLSGKIVDIGCGSEKITPDAIGIDGRTMGHVSMVIDHLDSFSVEMYGTADVAFSSHVLEHTEDDYKTLQEWTKLIKPGGLLILYLPDGRYYDNYTNPEHFRDYTYEQFMLFFRRAFCGEGRNFRGEATPKIYDLVEHGMDVALPDKYSFYVVARKT